MRATYLVRAWRDNARWLAQVKEILGYADLSPMGALTESKTLNQVEEMAFDLIHTIIDSDDFDLKIQYVLPLEDELALNEALVARDRLEAAQKEWKGQATKTARYLAEKGYTTRETGKLLGISHQRVSQLIPSQEIKG